MIVLIDADIVCYRCSASSENEEEDTALYRCDELIRRIIHDVGATAYEVFLNGSENYRYSVDKEYKAHRKDVTRPKYLEACRAHVVSAWNGVLSDGVETDDEIGLVATSYWTGDVPFVVASLDKDLLQLPGKHYNFVKNVMTFVSPLEAKQAFWRQMLIGDPADNIKGVKGIGVVKAGKIIDPLAEEIDMYTSVLALYGDNKERFEQNAQLLWILKNKRDPQEVLSHFHTLQQQGEEAVS